jgi:hypothetical protein
MKSIITTSLLLLHCHSSVSFSLVKHSCQPQLSSSTSLFDSSAIDVEFTKSDGDDSDKNEEKPQLPQPPPLESTLEASLNLVEPHLRIPIEFTDPVAQSFIPCNLAYILEHNGVEYSIGTPVHTQVSVFCENDSGASYFLDPDLDENLELMEMAAAKFETMNECKLIFQRTPRTLTVQGDLDRLIDGWKVQDTNPRPSDVVDILDDSEEDEFFDTFFQKELGSNYKEKYLVEDAEMDKKVEDLMDAFNVPGMGSQKDDGDGIEELMNEMEKDLEISKQDPITWDVDGDETEQALRLVGFEGPDGKPYSLVKMIQPMILIAKSHEDLAPDQRLLLSKEEADEIVPILENEFEAELTEAGLIVAKYDNRPATDSETGAFE